MATSDVTVYLHRDAAAVDGQRGVDACDLHVGPDGGRVPVAARHLHRLDADRRLQRHGAADVQDAGLGQPDLTHRHRAASTHTHTSALTQTDTIFILTGLFYELLRGQVARWCNG